MLSMAGVELEPADLAALLQRTEGWPAALHVAALSIRGRHDRRAAVAAFAGDDRLMADYLRDEILAPLPLPAVAFLLRTSVLSRLSGPACDRLTGTAGSGTMLRELSRAGIPLVPLDRTDDEFRHHPLLAEMLRAEQRRRDPLRTADLHRRAAAWHEREGRLDEAVGHALAAGDDGDVAARLWAIAPTRIAHGRVRSIRAWLARVSPEQVAAHAPLALTAAATHLVDGDRDRLEHWLGRAERLIAERRGGRRLAGRGPRGPAGGARPPGDRGHGRRRRDRVRAHVRGRPLAPPGVPAARRGPAPARRPRPRRRAAGGGRAPRRPGRPQRPGALPRPARADPGRRRRLGDGGAARLPRPRPARAGGRRGLPELGAGLRGVGARAGPPRPRRGGPGRPPAGRRAARAARGPAGLVRRRDARRARPHHAAPR